MARRTPLEEELIWHELECGAYTADFGLWEELAEAADGPVLDLGCGSGRVAMHLARCGFSVVGVDQEPAFTAELDRRADEAGVDLRTVVADVTELSLNERFGLVLAPMQLVQMLHDAAERKALLGVISEHLAPGGRAALALVEPDFADDDADPPLPDVRDEDGWIYSSLAVAILDAGEHITVRRLRQTVSPAGELTDELNEVVICMVGSADLAVEAHREGLTVLERRYVPMTEDHVGSTVVILEA